MGTNSKFMLLGRSAQTIVIVTWIWGSHPRYPLFMIVSRQSADNRKWMAIDFCPEAEFLILIRGQFSISCLRQCDEENFLWPLCSNWVTPASEEKLSILTEVTRPPGGKSRTTRKRPLVIYWILNPVNQVRIDLWCGRGRSTSCKCGFILSTQLPELW